MLLDMKNEVKVKPVAFSFLSEAEQSRMLSGQVGVYLRRGRPCSFSLGGDYSAIVWPSRLVELLRGEGHFGSARAGSEDEILCCALGLLSRHLAGESTVCS